MSAAQPWLGTCHLTQGEGAAQESYHAIAAVFCDSHETYDDQLRAFIEPKGYQLLWSEDAHPAGQWITRFPKNRDAAGLARAVQPQHRVELGPLKTSETEDTAPESYLIIEEIEGIKPLDAQIGIHPRKCVPDKLIDPLFGQPKPTTAEINQYGSANNVPKMKTFAILDAAKVMHLPILLDSSGLDFKCLFKGKAEQELKDVAPYIVELELENSFTRNLFTSAGLPSNMWDREPGIYIRSRATLDELWKHFRKFTQLYSETTRKWRYFRFYAPEAVRTIIAAFDEGQFERFGKDITLIACQSKTGFCTLTRRPKSKAAQPLKVA